MAFGSVRAGRAFVELFVDNSKYVRGLRRSEFRLQQFARRTRQTGLSLVRASAAFLIPIGFSAAKFSQFQDQMLTVKAVTSGTADEFAKLTDRAKELGRTTSFTAQQVAAGMVSLGRAKFNRQEILDVTDDILALGRATGTELADAARIAGGAMNGFGLDADQMTRITDVMTFTVNNSAQNLMEYGEALKMVSGIASEAGDGIEDVSSLIATLANNSIVGTMAGTAIARAYKNLSSDKVTAMMDKLKVSVADVNDDMRPLAAIIRDIGDATADLGSRGRLAAFETLFGRGTAAALKLAAPTADLKDFREELDNVAGTAKATSAEMDSGMGGMFRRFMSAVEGVQLALGEALEGELTGWGEKGTEISAILTEMIGRHGGLIVKAVELAVAMGAGGVALIGMAAGGAALSFALAGLRNVVIGVRLAMLAVTATPFGVALLAAGAAAVALTAVIINLKSHTAQLSTGMAKARKEAEESAAISQTQMTRLEQLAAKQNLTNKEFNEARSLINSLNDEYGGMGLEIDHVTGKITGMTEAQKQLNETLERAAKLRLRSEIAKRQANIKELELEREHGTLLGTISDTAAAIFEGDPLGGGDTSLMRSQRKRDAAISDRITSERAAIQAAQLLLAGPGTDGSTAERVEAGRAAAAAEVVASEQAAAMNARIAREMHELRISQIDDRLKREIEAIDLHYKHEREKATELGADLAALDKLHTAEVEAAFADRDKREGEETRRRNEAAGRAELQLQQDIARLKIETSGDSAEKIKSDLRQLERVAAFSRAVDIGADPGLVNAKFDLLDQVQAAGARTARTPVGSFSAVAAQALGRGGGDSAAEKTAKNTDVIAKNTTETVEKIDDLQLDLVWGT